MPSTLKVGGHYNPGRRTWPEGGEFNFRGGELELLLLFKKPNPVEIAAVARGAVRLAFLVEPPALFVVYAFGDNVIRWSDAPFTFHRVPLADRVLPRDEAQAPFRVILVDTTTGRVEALRLCLLAPDITAALHQAIREQAAAPFDEAGYDAAIDAVYQRLGTSAQMAARASLLTAIEPQTQPTPRA